MAVSTNLDSIDRLILTELQHEGRLSNQDLAQRVHLSPSACLRRVKALEDSGVIAQYVALVNPKAVGKHGISFTIINLESMNTPQLEAFEQAVRDPRPPSIPTACVIAAKRRDHPSPLPAPLAPQRCRVFCVASTGPAVC